MTNEHRAIVELSDAELDLVTGGCVCVEGVTLLNPVEHPVGGPCNARTENNGFYQSDGRGAYFQCGCQYPV